MSTIIRGCFYTDGVKVMQAHYSGDFLVVDGTDCYKWSDFIGQYGRDPIDDDFNYDYDGKTYYSTGDYSPHHTKNLKLITDISELTFDGGE